MVENTLQAILQRGALGQQEQWGLRLPSRPLLAFANYGYSRAIWRSKLDTQHKL